MVEIETILLELGTANHFIVLLKQLVLKIKTLTVRRPVHLAKTKHPTSRDWHLFARQNLPEMALDKSQALLQFDQ